MLNNSYYNNILKCQTEQELFDIWSQKDPFQITYMENNQEITKTIDHKTNVFIRDGIVDEKTWNNNNHKKIVFVLKEAYTTQNNWSLTDWVLNSKPSKPIWRRIIEWTYGIQNTDFNNIPKYASQIYEKNKDLLFQQIALVNLKKSGGKSSSINEEIKGYAIEDKLELKKQLEIISPDIIVCGSTFNTLNHIYDDKICPKDSYCDNRFYYTNIISGKDTLVIDYYHPSNRYPALFNYYTLASIYQQSLY